ncbi:MAG TPA: indolepyruvate ferredoxin oxidoreductase subunit alpha [Woeseiaceae bacterium]
MVSSTAQPFAADARLLRLGDGEIFHGEGIMAVAKGLLQAGVGHVAGYQGAPVSHLMDVFASAGEILDELGVNFEFSASEAGAAASLSASINYPVRTAAIWKSPVGTNVASDALSNLASAGVTGGALIVLGEDYGEGSSAIQERTHAFAQKSQIWLLDPRPDLNTLVEMIEHGFGLSEFSGSPVMLELRVRLCHLHGRFICKNNRRPAYSRHQRLAAPRFDYAHVTMPPSTYAQEREKITRRWPRAIEYIRAHRLNELVPGERDDVGFIVQGGLYNGLLRALQLLGLAAVDGRASFPVYVMNVTYPLVPAEIEAFCSGKRAVLVIEEGQPSYIEDGLHAVLRKAGIATRVAGEAFLPQAGELTGETLLQGVARFVREVGPRGVDVESVARAAAVLLEPKRTAGALLKRPVPARPPTFCTGCPERPVFTALKLLQKEMGPLHLCADIGCHTFSVLPPFNIGNSILGYGLGLASSTSVSPLLDKRVVSVMGDGGFWHNGLTSGIASSVFNKSDGILVIMKNGYTAATGAQRLPSAIADTPPRPALSIERTLRAMGIRWLRRVRTYDIARMVRTMRQAHRSSATGLKVIVAEGECQLERQRRVRPGNAGRMAAGKRVALARYGVDDRLCTGDRSCIRLSGCPSLTVKANPDPLRLEPVATVNHECVGCGVCGEVAHAAVLCPSFHRVELVHNPNPWDRVRYRIGRWLVERFAPMPTGT